MYIYICLHTNINMTARNCASHLFSLSDFRSAFLAPATTAKTPQEAHSDKQTPKTSKNKDAKTRKHQDRDPEN